MSDHRDPDVLRSLFSSARRNDESAAPDLDDLLARRPARGPRWTARLLWGGACAVATVTAAAVALVVVPTRKEALPEPLSSIALVSPLPAPPAPPPPPPAGSSTVRIPVGVVGGGAGGAVSGTLDRLNSLGYTGGKIAFSASGTHPVTEGAPHVNEPLDRRSPPEYVTVTAQSPTVNLQSSATSVKLSDESFQANVAGVGNQDPLTGEWLAYVKTDSIEEFETVTVGPSGGFGLAEGGSVTVLKKKERDAERLEHANTERYGMVKENEFVSSTENPLSTFSIDVDTASYSVVRRFLNQGMLPPANAVRIEELVNYFPYSYPQPTGSDPFSVSVEIASCPWAKTHRLARIGLHGREERRESKATNLVFLIDVSGSMESPEKLPLLKSALALLVDQLGANDQVAIVVYAGASGLVLPSTPGSRAGDIRAALDALDAGGSTNGGEGLKLAYKVAREHLVRGGVNRVILATDGDFNVGVTDRGELMRLVEENAKAGVALTTLGFGMGNYNDETLETLADHGNGNHFYIDDEKEARKVLVEQVGGTLVTIAKDVKIQIEFNPRKVGAYRLLGYENRMLAKEDFNDDRKDAGEIGSGHDVTALYELVPPGEALDRPGVDALKYQTAAAPAAASDESFTVKLRYKDPDGETSRLLSVPATDSGVQLSAASEDTRFSAAVAAFGMVLRGSSHRGTADIDLCNRLASSGLGADPGGYRRDFLTLLEKARALR